ncbi:unnamed protein product [Caenorhabditis nigoni]
MYTESQSTMERISIKATIDDSNGRDTEKEETQRISWTESKAPSTFHALSEDDAILEALQSYESSERNSDEP